MRKWMVCMCVFLCVAMIGAGCATPETESVIPGDFVQDQPEGKTPMDESKEIIEDRRLLQELWEALLYDSITSIGNGGSFSHPSEIDIEYIAQFSFVKYIREYGTDALVDDLDEGAKLISIEQVEEMARKYLLIEELDLSRLPASSYIEEKDAFRYYYVPEPHFSSYESPTPWSIVLKQVSRLDEHTYEAVLESRFGEEMEWVETIWTYTVSWQPEDGTWVFLALDKTHPDNNLVQIEGTVDEFSSIKNFEGSPAQDHWRILKEKEDGFFLMGGIISTQENYTQVLGILDLANQNMVQLIDLGPDIYGLKATEQGVLVKKRDKVLVYDDALQRKETILLPEKIASLSEREITYDEDFFPLQYYGGYDIAEDLSRICYTDEEGLKIFDLATGVDRLLSTTHVFENDNMLPRSFYTQPEFVAQDTKIFSGLTGYESMRDYTLLDLSGYDPEYALGLGNMMRVVLDQSHESLLLIDTEDIYVLTLDDRKRQRVESDTQLRGMVDGYELSALAYDGYAAFTTSEAENQTVHVYRIDKEKLQLEGPVISITNAQMTILGVLMDGRILVSYDRYPNESGYLLTRP